ncbi:hypothetical protein NW801_08430 [Brevibacillus laterosporus]|uniref:Uncharacterized protein n=1 Tax=Brevibacillus halotolerans TaxID=1507437 RepID=A0ABT4HW57_9BACL|nr:MULTISPECIES: hypothetical protein [Brevibacillus]MCR8985094.1 hypothetical protein [Brevibacillus laterosporus]MCZ0830823.1 hypothetical protein [Brevibacillus halotolerans]
MKNPIETISITDKQLYFLACLTGADQVLGIAEPYAGYLTEDLQEEWDLIKTELLHKGYIFEDETGLYIDEMVNSLVAPCGHATTCCYFRYTDKHREAYEGYFHFDREVVVEKIAALGGKNVYELRALGEPLKASKTMCNRIRKNAEEKVVVPSIELPNAIFQQIRGMVETASIDEICATLMDYQCHQDAAEAFAQSLKAQWCEGQLITMSWHQNEWSLNGMTFLTSSIANWLIRLFVKEREDWVCISPSSHMEMDEVLQEIILEKLIAQTI